MRTVRTLLLAGLSVAALAGTAGLARARGPETHVLTVQLPDGSMEQINYAGDVPPRVMVVPMSEPMTAIPAPMAWSSPFAMIDRLSAEMNQQAAIMLRQAAAMANQPLADFGPSLPAGLGNLPQGGQTHLFVANLSGGDVCARSVTITSRGDGEPPSVVSHVSGQCGVDSGHSLPARQLVPPSPRLPAGTIEVKAPTMPPGQLIRPAVWQQP